MVKLIALFLSTIFLANCTKAGEAYATKPSYYAFAHEPKKIALLLPLTGVLSEPGHAVKEGFMAAVQTDDNGKTRRTVQLYDTNSLPIYELYKQAIADGADFVVGPLSKPEVNAIASVEHPVPTLLLNDTSIPVKSNAYLFGLSPSYEAQQVAIKAKEDGKNKALIIAPAGDWGNDVVLAFTREWQKQGGEVAGDLRYGSKENLNLALRDFLHVSASEQRGKSIKQLLGKEVETVPARRKDFDMIFVLAYPSKARQIIPLLKYYYAGDIPVYATSNSYAGSPNAMRDRDLDRVMFCDMPWIFNHNVANKNWPEQFNSYNRLYALGMDSYALVSQLNNNSIHLNTNQQIIRPLAWGKFEHGVAKLLMG